MDETILGGFNDSMKSSPNGKPDFRTAISNAIVSNRRLRLGVTTVLGLSLIGVEPVVAQNAGADFCASQLADTIRNIFNLIQWGGPLLGGVIAIGSMVLMPVSSVERKVRLKEMRNQAIVYGVIAASLGTLILRFILNNIVVGGLSCGF